MEPEGYAPYEDINHEIYDGHHDKSVNLRIPLKYPSEKTYNSVKTDTVQNDAYNILILRNICVSSKPEYSRQGTNSAGQDYGYKLYPAKIK